MDLISYIFWKYLLVLFGILSLQKGSVFAEVVISPVNVSVSENKPVTLTCSLTGTTETPTSFAWYLKSQTAPSAVGVLTSSCQSVIVSINTNLYGYSCSTRQSTWTIKKVIRGNYGDRYQCQIDKASGVENSGYTFLNIQVPVSSVTMTVPSTVSVTVSENVAKEFQCKTSGGLPEATVTWYKDSGTPETTSDDIEIFSNIQTSSRSVNGLIEVTSNLMYSPTRTENGWRIYCTASNANGQTSLVSQRKPLLNVHYPPDGPPVITGYNNGSEYRVIEGKQGQLFCSVSGGNPAATLTWDCVNTGTLQINSSGGTVTGVYTWIALRGEDRTCTCKSSHYSGKSSVSIRIKILYPPTKPTFKIRSVTVSGIVKVIRHNSLSVNCSSSGQPEPSYKWTYPNTTISIGSLLSVGSVQNDDRYTCQVQNTMDSSESTSVTSSNSSFIDISILYGPEVGRLSDKYIEAGSAFNVSCPVVRGNPSETTFRWSRSKDNLVWNDQILLISNVSKHDVDVYTCRVQNTMKPTGAEQKIGEDTRSFHLNVLYEPVISAFFIKGHENEEQQLVTVNEHDEVIFTCDVESNPAPTIEIIHDNRVLGEQTKTKSLSFILNNVACLQAGVYACEARNKAGKAASKNVMMLVRCSPRPLYQIKHNTTGTRNNNVTLSFTVLAYPEPGPTGFSWHKEIGTRWIPLLTNADLQISSNGVQTNLTVLNVSQQDFGQYRVTVTNEIGRYEQYLFLIEESSRNAAEGKDNDNNTAMIVGVTLGLTSCIFVAYAIGVTIYFKRKVTNEGRQPMSEKTGKRTYINMSFDESNLTGQRNRRHNMANTSNEEMEDAIHQYTELGQYRENNATPYEVIEQVK